MPRSANPKPAAPPRGRLRLKAAAEYLAVSVRTVWTRVAEGVLTNATPPAERGKGRPAFVWRDEVEVLAAEGEAACRDLRHKLRRDR